MILIYSFRIVLMISITEYCWLRQCCKFNFFFILEIHQTGPFLPYIYHYNYISLNPLVYEVYNCYLT